MDVFSLGLGTSARTSKNSACKAVPETYELVAGNAVAVGICCLLVPLLPTLLTYDNDDYFRWVCLIAAWLTIVSLYKCLNVRALTLAIYDWAIVEPLKETLPVPKNGPVDLSKFNEHPDGSPSENPFYDWFYGGSYAVGLWAEGRDGWTPGLFCAYVAALYVQFQVLGWGLLFMARHFDLNNLYSDQMLLFCPNTKKSTEVRIDSLHHYASTLYTNWYYTMLHFGVLVACGLKSSTGSTPVYGMLFNWAVHFYLFWPVAQIQHLIFHQKLWGHNLYVNHKFHHTWSADAFGTANNDDDWAELKYLVLVGKLLLPIGVIKLSPWSYSAGEFFFHMCLYKFIVNADHQNYDLKREWWWPMNWLPGFEDSIRNHSFHHAQWARGSTIKICGVGPSMEIEGSAFGKSWTSFLFTPGSMDPYEKDEYRRRQLIKSPHYIFRDTPLKRYLVPKIKDLVKLDERNAKLKSRSADLPALSSISMERSFNGFTLNFSGTVSERIVVGA